MATPPPVLQPPPPTELIAVPRAVARPTASVFGTFSRLRGRRAMHPKGVVVRADLRVPDRDDLPRGWRDLDGSSGIARFSKSVGLPAGVPDVLGIALRFGAQDLLLASAGRGPVLQNLLRPAGGFGRVVFSSLLPHRVGTSVAIVQAEVEGWWPPADEPLEAVRVAAGSVLGLWAVGLLGGRRRIGFVTVGAEVTGPDAARVRFDPWRAGAGLAPAGPFQRWRASAYAASRRAVPR